MKPLASSEPLRSHLRHWPNALFHLQALKKCSETIERTREGLKQKEVRRVCILELLECWEHKKENLVKG